MTTKIQTIGILVFAKAPRLHLPPLRIRALAAEALMHGAQAAFFCAADCDMERNRIRAEIWSPEGWLNVTIPVPNVVLIVTNPLRAGHRQVNHWIRRLTAFVADHSPNKLALPILLADTPLKPYVIPQIKVQVADASGQIESWIRAHGDCVVKPVDGKRGRGIYRLHAGTNGGWLVRKDAEIDNFGTAAEAAALVARRIAGRMRYRSYIAQTYIWSTSADGRAADIRVHVQRDDGGLWRLTRAYARLGETGAAVSNVSKGGYQGPVDGFLATRRKRSVQDVIPSAVITDLRP